MALETPGTFFFFFSPFFLKEVVPVSPENWWGGEGRTSALAFMEPRPAQTKSSPKREALDGGGEREQRRRSQAHESHVEDEARSGALFDNKPVHGLATGEIRSFSSCASSVHHVTIKIARWMIGLVDTISSRGLSPRYAFINHTKHIFFNGGNTIPSVCSS